FELFFRFQVHAKCRIQSACPRLRRGAIRVHQIKRRPVSASTSASTPAATASSATSGGLINQFVTIRTDVIRCHSGHERGRATITQSIALQRISPTTRSSSTASAVLPGARFQKVNSPAHARFELRILMGGNTGHRENPLLDVLEIDLNGYWT